MRAKISSLEPELKEFGTEAEARGDEPKADFSEVRKKLDAQIAEARNDLADLNATSGNAWDALKADIDQAVSGIEQGIENAREKLTTGQRVVRFDPSPRAWHAVSGAPALPLSTLKSVVTFRPQAVAPSASRGSPHAFSLDAARGRAYNQA